VNKALIYTWSAQPNFSLSLWWWTNDWGAFHAFSAAPSYNLGFNQGQCAITEIRAYMPVANPAVQKPQLAYVTFVKNQSGIGVSSYDIFAIWQ
jgi:hypothetical protein